MGQAQTKKKEKNNSIKKSMQFDAKEEYFIRNGAILLEHQVRISKGRDIATREIKIFSQKEIEKATNNYDESNLIDKIHRHEEKISKYKATLDNHIVTIGLVPSSLNPNIECSKTLLNAVSTSMVMNHENLLRIYGCCLETRIPMLVCEYVHPTSLLVHHLHDDKSIKHFGWDIRKKVIIEIAYALSYMHNALSKPLVHRNLSSVSIFLDSSNQFKLGRFGYAVSVNLEDTSQRWPIEGTIGYIDPEYIETKRVTDKCDVYSLGVLMIEILTRRQPQMMANTGINLVDVFVSALKENKLKDLIDKKVLEEASWDEIQKVVQLALVCVAKEGCNRPTMIDIVGVLWKIQGRGKK